MKNWLFYLNNLTLDQKHLELAYKEENWDKNARVAWGDKYWCDQTFDTVDIGHPLLENYRTVHLKWTNCNGTVSIWYLHWIALIPYSLHLRGDDPMSVTIRGRAITITWALNNNLRGDEPSSATLPGRANPLRLPLRGGRGGAEQDPAVKFQVWKSKTFLVKLTCSWDGYWIWSYWGSEKVGGWRGREEVCCEAGDVFARGRTVGDLAPWHKIGSISLYVPSYFYTSKKQNNAESTFHPKKMA